MGDMRVRSIGLLSSRDLQGRASELSALRNRTPAEDRQAVAQYLRGGAVIFAVMEYTRDVLDDAFGVSGGSGIRSDGTFFWRGDAAEYVAAHGIGVALAFLDHCRALDFTPPVLSHREVIAIDDHLTQLFRGA